MTTKCLCLLAFLYLSYGCAFSPNPRTPSPAVTTLYPTPEIQPTPGSLEAVKERGVLVVGTAVTKPFEFYNPKTNVLVGMDVDIANSIARQLGVSIQWVEMPFASLIPSLQNNRVDMVIAAMYINPERASLVDFSNPYISTGLTLAVRPELAGKIRSPADLNGKKVGVKIGATGEELANEWKSQGIDVEIHEYKETLDSLLDLEVGRIDVVVNDYLNTLAYIQDTQSQIKIVTDDANKIYFLSNAGLGIAVHQGNKTLLAEINSILSDMQTSGKLSEIQQQWLNTTPGH